jgi:hypothetical protein
MRHLVALAALLLGLPAQPHAVVTRGQECDWTISALKTHPIQIARSPAPNTSLRIEAVSLDGEPLRYAVLLLGRPSSRRAPAGPYIALPVDTTLSPGAYHIVVRLVGFRQRDTTLLLPRQGRLTLRMPLERHPCLLH